MFPIANGKAIVISKIIVNAIDHSIDNGIEGAKKMLIDDGILNWPKLIFDFKLLTPLSGFQLNFEHPCKKTKQTKT